MKFPNHCHNFFITRFIFLTSVFLFVLAGTGYPQSSVQAGHARKVGTENAEQRQNAHRLTLGEAQLSAKRSQPQGAERALTQLNRAKPGTAEWHIETAQRLIHLAGDLVRDGHEDKVSLLVVSALDHLEKADRHATTAPIRASIKVFEAFIYERFRSDPIKAIARYQDALRIKPDSPKATEALTRLQNRESLAHDRKRQR